MTADDWARRAIAAVPAKPGERLAVTHRRRIHWLCDRKAEIGEGVLIGQLSDALRELVRGESSAALESIRLRPVRPSDLPAMYDLQCDPESNRIAVTNPRTREAFDRHWAESLDDPKVVARVVLADDEFAGYISCFPVEGSDHVGYWIDRAFWGIAIASRALQLLLLEFTRRPLVAIVATSNEASLRVLRKSGFVVEQIRLPSASERYPECEEAVLVLR